MHQKIVNHAHLSLSYIKGKIDLWSPNDKLKPIVDVLKQCEHKAMENINMTLFIHQLDVEIKSSMAIEECISTHLSKVKFDSKKMDDNIEVKSRELLELKKELGL